MEKPHYDYPDRHDVYLAALEAMRAIQAIIDGMNQREDDTAETLEE